MDGRASRPRADRGLRRPDRIKKRRGFLAAARARKANTPGFLLQARRRRPDEPFGDGPRLGFTASKKVGNAVARNRAKRRLRALADELAPIHGRDGWDYVLIARAHETASRPFAELRAELIKAFDRVHADAPRKKRGSGDAAADRPQSSGGTS